MNDKSINPTSGFLLLSNNGKTLSIDGISITVTSNLSSTTRMNTVPIYG